MFYFTGRIFRCQSAEYLIGYVDAWIAPKDTVRPVAPNLPVVSPWVKLGTNRLPDEGVTWEVPQTINPERSLNSIFSDDAFRVEADQMIGFSVKDFTAEVLSIALNDAEVDTEGPTATNVGYVSVGVSAMGVAVAKHALLVRVDNSPYIAAGGGYVSEFWGPEVYEMSNFTTALGSRAVSMVPFQFMSLLTDAVAHADDRMGSWRLVNASTT